LEIVDEPPDKVRVLVAALPDMGNVAGIAMDYLVKNLKLVKFAKLVAYWPPFIKHKGGDIEYERSSFWFYKPSREDWGFIAFSGSFQPHEPMFLYELCEDVIKYAKELGVETVITLGAAHSGAFVYEPQVFYASTSEELKRIAEECDAVPLEGEGYITGFNGLLLGIAKENGLESLCLLGEIDNPEIRQPKAAKHVLMCLAKILGLGELDYSKLDKEAEEIRARLSLIHEYRRLRKTLGQEPPGVV